MKTVPAQIHRDFHSKLVDIQKYYNEKHHVDLTFGTITKIIADNTEIEDVDLFKNNKDMGVRKKKVKIGEVTSGFGYTEIMR